MLVISRKAEEGLQLGQEIHITVLAIRSDHVKLGVRAPAEISILRSELLDRVRQSNLRSASFDPIELLGQKNVVKPPERVCLRLPSVDPEQSKSFYLEKGFQANDQARPNVLTHPNGLEIEFYAGPSLAQFSFALSADAHLSWTDPNGYQIAI
jgi:carbon storage regulator